MSTANGAAGNRTEEFCFAALPETPGFTASLGTTSGSLEYTLPLSRSGDQYVCGDGSAQVEIHTTSGNIRVRPTEQK